MFPCPKLCNTLVTESAKFLARALLCSILQQLHEAVLMSPARCARLQFVVKRSGKKEPVHFDKITARISKLCYGLDPAKVQPVLVAQKVRRPTGATPRRKHRAHTPGVT